MNTTLKRRFAAALSALVIPFSLCACSSNVTESFDARTPWLDTAAAAPIVPSYEKLSYDVTIYDTANGAATDVRTAIASGSLTFELEERAGRDYTDINMSYSVTYNSDADELDRGLTDVITSTTTFQTGSLFTSYMKKTVALADRADTENKSYTVEADYFGTHTAKKYAPDKPEEAMTMQIPEYGTYHDNEMLFYLGRAQALAAKASVAFYMTNIFDSFLYGKFTNYQIAASCAEALVTVEMDPWVADFGIEPPTEEGKETYSINCYYTTLMINADKHGPPYIVYYSEAPFKSGEGSAVKEHCKLPLMIAYDEYSGNKQVRHTEYKLAGCAFDKE